MARYASSLTSSSSSRPHLELAVKVLGDRLDHQVAIGEIRVVEGRGDAPAHGVRLRLLHLALLDRAGELLLDLRHALVERLLIDLPHHHVPARLRADLRDPVAHQAAAQDADLADRHMCSLPLSRVTGGREHTGPPPARRVPPGRNHLRCRGFLLRMLAGSAQRAGLSLTALARRRSPGLWRARRPRTPRPGAIGPASRQGSRGASPCCGQRTPNRSARTWS